MTPRLNELIQSLPDVRILVVGDIMLDHYIWGDATRISPEAPVPVVNVYEDTWQAGGAANVALNLTALSVNAGIVGVCAEDDAGDKLRAIFDERGVDRKGLQMTNEAPTIRKTRIVVQKQQICRVDRESSTNQYALPDLAEIQQACRDVDAVIVSDYAKGVVSNELLNLLAGERVDSRPLLAIDPKPKRRLDYEGADLITPNRSEALELAGISIGHHDPFPARAVCDAIWKAYHPHRLVVTLGAGGMLLVREGEILGRLPTRAREVFDVSGAGDTVISVLTAALAAGATLLEAAHLANAAAGIVVAKFGAATVSPNELQSIDLESDLELIQVD
ncbi:MAG: PfkB family carbohydrate kinase [Verrucomicrobiota bacterium]